MQTQPGLKLDPIRHIKAAVQTRKRGTFFFFKSSLKDIFSESRGADIEVRYTSTGCILPATQCVWGGDNPQIRYVSLTTN